MKMFVFIIIGNFDNKGIIVGKNEMKKSQDEEGKKSDDKRKNIGRDKNYNESEKGIEKNNEVSKDLKEIQPLNKKDKNGH